METFYSGVIPRQNTIASFYEGKTADKGKVLIVYRDDLKCLVVTDISPFHPLDYNWKDQPGDRGTIVVNDLVFEVSDTLTWPIAKNCETLSYSADLPIKRGTEGHILLTAHVIERVTKGEKSLPLADVLTSSLIGKEAQMVADEHHRYSLNRPHSGSHLIRLALNRVLSPLWRKECLKDCLGGYDFYAVAISESIISPNVSTDVFRLGKSLRKKGFSSDDLLGDIEEYRGRTETLMNNWISELENVEITLEGEDVFLGSYRTWNTVIEGKKVTIPCGGTHVKRIGDIGPVVVKMEYTAEAKQLRVTVSV